MLRVCSWLAVSVSRRGPHTFFSFCFAFLQGSRRPSPPKRTRSTMEGRAGSARWQHRCSLLLLLLLVPWTIIEFARCGQRSPPMRRAWSKKEKQESAQCVVDCEKNEQRFCVFLLMSLACAQVFGGSLTHAVCLFRRVGDRLSFLFFFVGVRVIDGLRDCLIVCASVCLCTCVRTTRQNEPKKGKRRSEGTAENQKRAICAPS